MNNEHQINVVIEMQYEWVQKTYCNNLLILKYNEIHMTYEDNTFTTVIWVGRKSDLFGTWNKGSKIICKMCVLLYTRGILHCSTWWYIFVYVWTCLCAPACVEAHRYVYSTSVCVTAPADMPAHVCVCVCVCAVVGDSAAYVYSLYVYGQRLMFLYIWAWMCGFLFK